MRKLTRPRNDKMLAGVCGAVANYFKIDATIVRLAAVLLAICTLGTAIVVYGAGWLLIPEEEDSYAAWA